jgi:hypothetical protein
MYMEYKYIILLISIFASDTTWILKIFEAL